VSLPEAVLPVVKQGTEVTKDQVQTLSSQSTTPVQPPAIRSETQTLVSEPIVASINVPIPYPSRRDNERRHDQVNEQIEKFYEIFKEMSFEISFTDALILMPKFASTLKALIINKEKLSEMARTLMNEHCSAVILNKLPRKLGDPGKFLIPCEFPGMDECLALADLDTTTSGNPTPYDDSIFSATSPTLTPFGDSDFLLFEEADAFLGLEDDPNSPEFDPSYYDPEGDILLLEAILNSEPLPPFPNHEQYMPSYKKELKVCEAKTVKSSIDEPFEVELKDLPPHLEYFQILIDLCDQEKTTFTCPYETFAYRRMPFGLCNAPGTFQRCMLAIFYDMVEKMTEVFMDDFSVFRNSFENCLSRLDKMLLSPTPDDDPIISTTSPTLTLFGDSDFLLFEEADAFLGLEDDPDLPKINPFYYDPEGDILLLEAILIANHYLLSPTMNNICLRTRRNSKSVKPKLLKLPLMNLLKLSLRTYLPISSFEVPQASHRLELSDIQGINPEFCTHKILIEEDYKPTVQHQRRVNPKIHHVIKKEVEKLLDAGLIYPISNSPWVSPVYYVPKKGGFTVVENEENELIPTLTGWRVCIDYRKLNEPTRKDQFPLPFMDQMLERLAGNEYYCFLDGFSGYFQIPIDPRDQEKTTFTCPYGTFAYRRMPFGLCNAPGTL
nr:reverse transcriptase domain-containing protein [Tanacetum cinerariifolium]